ncbi:MAG: recombinase family protein [Planctomycetes bacterium]|nr:recombinase family protein [Planctomycetota bacterium]NOG53118.1 recombinase family protein [Planctomycetota bacterium]
MSQNRDTADARTRVRCAIYTRKSTEEGLEQEFNSLDAQRESAENYIASQVGEGWVCLPDRYDDGGFTGGNMERPALKRLLTDIAAGKIDCVVVYKVDRLSRSLLDFSRMMEVFDKHGISFVSVTQLFNTANSMGRLMLNVLLSFAQFEREIISERTRDKIAATRRKGKWTGGHPVLGYDIDRTCNRLEVNEDEAARVRQMYDLYVEHQALLPVVRILNERGWRTKQWVTKKGRERGGRDFNKCSLRNLLTNVVYLGKVRHKANVYEGEHEGIVVESVWKRVQQILARNGRTGGASVRNKYGALLKGLLLCVPCGCSMGHTYTSKRKGPSGAAKRYRYYVCLNAQKRGWHSCPSKSVPAAEMERFVVEQIRAIGQDPLLVAATVQQARQQAEESIQRLEQEQKVLRRQVQSDEERLNKVAVESGGSGQAVKATARLADLHEQIQTGQRRLTEVNEQLIAVRSTAVNEIEAARALAAFEPVWEMLSPAEQARIIHLLVERIDYDGAQGKVAVTFRPAGLKALAAEPIPEPSTEEAAA